MIYMDTSSHISCPHFSFFQEYRFRIPNLFHYCLTDYNAVGHQLFLCSLEYSRGHNGLMTGKPHHMITSCTSKCDLLIVECCKQQRTAKNIIGQNDPQELTQSNQAKEIVCCMQKKKRKERNIYRLQQNCRGRDAALEY